MSKQQNTTTQEEAIRRYDALPDELKQVMSSVASAETIYGIGKKFGLNVEETGNLASLIGYTVLGMVSIAKFIDSIKDVTGADNAKAAEIAREVNAKIFLAIREQLKKTHGEKWDERALREPITDNLRPITMPTIKPTIDNQQPTTKMSAAPKSPWEIRPDGLGKLREQPRTVVPPVSQPTTNNLQPTKAVEAEIKKAALMQSEPPKTREAPQPAPAPRAPEVLKEIKPVGQPTTNNRQPATEKPPTSKPETSKAASSRGLPVVQKAETLMRTPELNKPITNNKQPTTETPPMPLPPQPVSAPKPPTPQAISQPIPATPASTSAQKYAVDPYREPIE